MILRAKHHGNVIVFELEGHLDFESTQQLEETCFGIIQEKKCSRVVFNMEKLRFVGSSGINQFIRTIKEFNQLEEKPKYCNLSSEFQKIFKAFQTSRKPFEVFECQDHAIASFDQSETEQAVPKKRLKIKPV